MTAAPARKSGDRRRQSLTAKVHIAKKELNLGDDAYRDILQRLFQKPSSKNLSQTQLVDLVEHFKKLGWQPKKGNAPKRAGKRRLATTPVARKELALWLSLYHLGCISDPSQSALAAFVKRQAKVDDPGFQHNSFSAIEALKAWAARDTAKGGGGVDWSSYATTNGRVDYPRARVLEAQWRMLHTLGEVKIADTGALANWIDRRRHEVCAYTRLPDEDADRMIEEFGAWIRRARAKKSA